MQIDVLDNLFANPNIFFANYKCEFCLYILPIGVLDLNFCSRQLFFCKFDRLLCQIWAVGAIKVVRVASLDDTHSERTWHTWSQPTNYPFDTHVTHKRTYM